MFHANFFARTRSRPTILAPATPVMLILTSPSKSQTPRGCSPPFSCEPQFLEKSQILVDQLRQLSTEEIGRLMKTSPKLSESTRQRFRDFHRPFTPDNCSPALCTFSGDTYRTIGVSGYGDREFRYAHHHLAILSGLYGLLRPLDLMMPYRLEIGLQWRPDGHASLYDFWRAEVSAALAGALEGGGEPLLINLASQEYRKVLDQRTLAGRIVDIVFRQPHGGGYRTVAIHAKRARGAMLDYAVVHQLTEPRALQGFDRLGYAFNSSASSARSWVFDRLDAGGSR